jgi:glycosyltransferase involved in cell wall biosynthesis
MRIALVTHHAHAFAGVPQYVSCLARSLSAQHDVTVISSTFDGLEGTGIHHRRLRAIGSGGPVFELSFFLSSAITLWRERRSEAGFDVVHSHHYSSPLFSDLLTSHYCEVEGIRQVRRRPTGAPVPGFRQRLRSRIMAAMEAALFGASSVPTPKFVA